MFPLLLSGAIIRDETEDKKKSYLPLLIR